MIETKIIDYLKAKSRGIIKLSNADARELIEIVKGKRKENTAYVKMFRKNHCNNIWEHQKNTSTTDELVKHHVALALETTPPNEDFYKYDCFNSLGEYEGCVFTTNPNLFDN